MAVCPSIRDLLFCGSQACWIPVGDGFDLGPARVNMRENARVSNMFTAFLRGALPIRELTSRALPTALFAFLGCALQNASDSDFRRPSEEPCP